MSTGWAAILGFAAGGIAATIVNRVLAGRQLAVAVQQERYFICQAPAETCQALYPSGVLVPR